MFYPNNMGLPLPLPMPIPNPDMNMNDNIINKLNELESYIKKLEQRIIKLENSNNHNYNEPDNSFYMI